MTKLPADVKPKKLLKVCKKLGFIKVKSKGSHQDFKHPDGRRTSIPIHPKPIPKGTFKAILNQIEISIEEFKKLLK